MYHNKIQVTRSREQFNDPRVAELPLSNVYYPEDEIGLLDIWLVLVKRRYVVMAVFALCVLGSLIPIFLTPPVYESRTVLEIGNVANVGPLENRDSLVQRLTEKHRIDDASEGPRPLPHLNSAGYDKKSAPDTITLTAEGEDAKQAQNYLWQVVNQIVAEHEVRFEKALQEHKNQLTYIEQQYEAYQSQVQQLTDRIKAVEKQDPSQAALLTLEKGKLIAEQPELMEKRIKLSLAMVEPQSSPTRLVRNPTLPVNPVKPKKTLYLVLAVVLGVVLGVFAAFFVEFIAKAREQLKVKQKEESVMAQNAGGPAP